MPYNHSTTHPPTSLPMMSLENFLDSIESFARFLDSTSLSEWERSRCELYRICNTKTLRTAADLDFLLHSVVNSFLLSTLLTTCVVNGVTSPLSNSTSKER